MLIFIVRMLFFITAITFLLVGLNATAKNTTDIFVSTTGLVFVIIAIVAELLTPKKSLSTLAGVFFGLLIGLIISYYLSPILDGISLVWFEMSL